MKDQRTLIVGAGLGGVAFAALMAQAGFEVDIYEQAQALGEIGAGIQMSPNACRVLDSLGLMERLRACAAHPTEYRFRLFDTGEVLQKIPLGQAYRERHGVPYMTVHRADLHRILTERLAELDPGAMHLAERVTGFDEDERGVRLAFASGTQVAGDLLVGADGVRSLIRDRILGPTAIEFTGDQAWRLMVPAERLPEHARPSTVDIWVGPGRHVVVYPLRGGRLVNFVGLVEDERWTESSWTAARPREDAKADFEGWHGEVQAIIDAADRDACYRWALNLRKPVGNWRTDRAVLLGDAAHATLPYMAQGAAMAIEDAAVLCRSLQRDVPLPTALEDYQQARLPRTTRVINESAGNRALFHLPTADALRAAFATRDVAAERNAWLFSYDATTVPLGKESEPVQTT